MDEREWLAERFEANRDQLRAVAHRLLGSLSEADDAVRESWLRLSRSEPREAENPWPWLTTVVARVCLDRLRSDSLRSDRSRREEPGHEVLLADSVGVALLVVLEALSPPERLTFVLHHMFGVPLDEIVLLVEG